MQLSRYTEAQKIIYNPLKRQFYVDEWKFSS